jgi:hypothetical protein
MFTANLNEYKTRQNELIRQAEHYRLVKSLQQEISPLSRFVKALGRVLVDSGRQLLVLSRAAN